MVYVCAEVGYPPSGTGYVGSDDKEITPGFEQRVYSYYGLRRADSSSRREVSVERVLVEGGTATEAQIGEDEISIPLTEEEVVVEKRPVAKEEVRVRKDVVEDTEVVEEDVRREEIDIDDERNRRTP